MMKHPQHIIAFDKSAFGINGLEGFIRISPKAFFECAFRSLFIGRRAELEADERFGQALPYIVLWQWHEGEKRVFVYRRTKLVGEQRLAGAMSVGTGGHMDLMDVRCDDKSVIDVVATFAIAINREIEEEIGFTFHNDSGDVPNVHLFSNIRNEHKSILPRFVGMINDTSDEVGRVHYGCVFSVEVPEGWAPVCREAELETIGWVHPAEALGNGEGALENWSRIVLENIDVVAQ